MAKQTVRLKFRCGHVQTWHAVTPTEVKRLTDLAEQLSLCEECALKHLEKHPATVREIPLATR